MEKKDKRGRLNFVYIILINVYQYSTLITIV